MSAFQIELIVAAETLGLDPDYTVTAVFDIDLDHVDGNVFFRDFFPSYVSLERYVGGRCVETERVSKNFFKMFFTEDYVESYLRNEFENNMKLRYRYYVEEGRIYAEERNAEEYRA